MDILVDEMLDGWDEELTKHGYRAQSVKKLRAEGKILGPDYNVIKHAQENTMILITKDTENGEACEANHYPCIWINDKTIFDKLVLVELEKFKDKSS